MLFLGRSDLEKVLSISDVIEGVKAVYQLKSKGETAVWPLVTHEFKQLNAVMDIRSGAVFGGEQLHGLKMLNNFPQNKEKGLPPFNGVLMIFDSQTGLPLGVMDAAYVTCMRTGAAGAVGAKALARSDSETLFVLGAGKQAMYQIAATLAMLPQLKKVYIADALNKENARRFAASCCRSLKEDFGMDRQNVAFEAAEDLAACVGDSDIVITITPARTPVIQKSWVRPGSHFSCIGADMEGKEEIDPQLFARARIYADDIPQCMRVGEMELPLKGGVIKKEDIIGEIGQVLAGTAEGRQTDEDITIFDATGLALLDLVTGKRALELAREKNLGFDLEL